jgi:hypothetical protein
LNITIHYNYIFTTNISYKQVQISLRESIKIAKVAQRHNKNAFTGAPVWHTVEKCPGMRKKDGKILVSISIHFEDEDTKQIQEVRT